MSDIEFTQKQKELMVAQLQDYFQSELGQDIGQFDAEFLLDLFARNMGAYFYNQGLHDAQKIIEHRFQSIDEDIYAIEKETIE